MTSPVVALLTDFGSRDPYVAAMKAVIASRCDAAILDLTHEIPPFDVAEAAFFLQFIANDFDTRRFIVVAVVDPGVGTDRRILALERQNVVYLAPDNGLLSLLLGTVTSLYSVENASLFRATGSSTFHGRDRFAPVAAAVANGFAVSELGPVVSDLTVVRLPYAPPETRDGVTRGSVITVDRFGNVISDVRAEALDDINSIVVNGQTISARARTYGEGRAAGGPFMIIGSRGTIEVSIANGSAADLLQVARFDSVTVRHHE